MDKKIIAMSGTHGVGKSVQAYNICAMLKKRGHNIVVLDELARECPFPINKEATNETQAWLICKQITRELELLQRYDYIIADRSVLDAYCYSEVAGRGDFIANNLLDYAIKHIKQYYRTLYVPDPDIFDYNVEDGVRDTDKVFRQDVHDKLIGVFEENNIDYLSLTNESQALLHILDNLEVK